MPRERLRERRGAVLVWVVLSLAVIIGVAALVLDGGRLMSERRETQTAANAAALAGAADLYSHYQANRGLDPSGTARTAAINAAVANGVTADEVTVNIPPASGTFAGQRGHVEVLIHTDINASFGRIFTQEPLAVNTRAVARGMPLRIGLNLLGTSGSTFVNRSPAFTVLGAPVIVNSSDPAAARQEAFGLLTALRFDIKGGFANPGSAVVLGRVRTGVRATPDPLAFLPVPSLTGPPIRSATPMTINSLLPTILDPGVYQGGLRITGAASVVMRPGVYVMEGGGFQIDGAATVAGDEVMIYNTAGAYAAGPISVTSTGRVAIAAPFFGTYQGVSFFQNRSLANPITLSGNGLAAVTGVVYGVRAPVNLTGGAVVGVDLLGGAYVVDSMTVQGIGGINIDLRGNRPRVPDVHLVE